MKFIFFFSYFDMENNIEKLGENWMNNFKNLCEKKNLNLVKNQRNKKKRK